MKSRKQYLIAIALAGAGLMLGIIADRSHASNLGATTVQGPPPPPNGPRILDQRQLDQLNLTDAQKEQIKALRDQERTASQSYQDQLRQVQDSILAAVEGSPFDEAAVRALAAAEGQAVAELSVIGARTAAAIYQLLTTDQRAKLAELQQQQPHPPAG